MRPTRKILLFLLLIIIIQACKPVNEIAVRNLSWKYQGMSASPDIRCTLVNVNDSVSRVFIAIPPQLPDNRFDTREDSAKAGYRIKYVLYNSWLSAAVADSGTVFYEFTRSRADDKPLKAEFNLRAPVGNDYFLYLKVLDIQHEKESEALKGLLKRNEGTADWFMVNDAGGELMNQRYLSNNSPVGVRCYNPAQEKFYVKVFRHVFQPALPPFVMEMREPYAENADSIFTILPSLENTASLSLYDQGIYHIQNDSSQTDGLSLVRFYDGYPAVTSPLRMIEAVRYITTSKEYDHLMQSSDTKAAIDSFWIATGGNLSRGLELIRKYYGRVEQANRLFPSCCEGWKTDMGMVYIIFGPPNVVYFNGNQEEWIYGEARNYHSVHFVFSKVVNPFSDEDYRLQRQPNYKEFWYMAVQQWRR
ncbi:MAG TPA: GWxTD domain-containing protein [Bacteroidales bacterium]|nr:GWxTD domain-containing protein [Bacteroidales bacterium]HPT00995.1 GWxTD domain-containing protein [Bacteroidales bacterium]